MTLYSTVPTVMAQLVTTLGPAVDPVPVSDSHPGDAQRVNAVWLGDVRGTSHIPILRAGRKTREEDYSVEVFISTATPGPTSVAARQQAFALYNAVEDALANDPTLSGTCLAAHIESFDLKTGYDDAERGWGALLTTSVAVQARLN